VGGVSAVSTVNPKTAGLVEPDVLSPELAQTAVAQGATPLENGTAAVPFFGYDGNGPMVPAPGAVPGPI
jgi:hypothetical protein